MGQEETIYQLIGLTKRVMRTTTPRIHQPSARFVRVKKG